MFAIIVSGCDCDDKRKHDNLVGTNPPIVDPADSGDDPEPPVIIDTRAVVSSVIIRDEGIITNYTLKPSTIVAITIDLEIKQPFIYSFYYDQYPYGHSGDYNYNFATMGADPTIESIDGSITLSEGASSIGKLIGKSDNKLYIRLDVGKLKAYAASENILYVALFYNKIGSNADFIYNVKNAYYIMYNITLQK